MTPTRESDGALSIEPPAGRPPAPAMPADKLAAGAFVLRGFTRRLAFSGVVLMLLIGVLSAFDVMVMRGLFGTAIAGSNEILETVFAVAIAMVLAGGLSDESTLEIDLLEKWLRPATVARLRAIGAAVFLVVLAAVAWRVSEFAFQAWQKQTQTMLLQWRVWPYYALIASAFLVCVPVQFLTFLTLVQAMSTGPRQERLQVGAIVENSLGMRLASDARGPLQGWAPRDSARAVLILTSICAVAWGLWTGVGQAQPYLSKHPMVWGASLFLLLWVVALLFIPIAAVLACCGALGTAGLLGSTSALSVLGSETVGMVTNTDLAVVPLFLMMGGFAVAGGLAQDLYRFAYAVFAPFRGGLALATIGGCAGFGAVTGSSLATIATIGPAAYPEMKARGYSPELATGCLVAGGTLGVLIPPSTVIVLYALLVEQSIGTLYIALLMPALLTVLLYMGAIMVTVWRNPGAAPGRGRWDAREALAGLKGCLPAIAIFVTVFGGMFHGLFTATEAAAIGTVLCFVTAALRGKLSRGSLLPVAVDTTRSTSMLYFVMIGALMVTFFMANSGVPEALSKMLAGSGLPPLAIICLIAIAYIVLGTAMDTITIMLITAPVLAALVVGLGYDPIWWGIMTVILVEIGVVSPPFGLNLFIIKTIAPEVSLRSVFRGVTPFLVADVIKVVILIALPAITLWLPSLAKIK